MKLTTRQSDLSLSRNKEPPQHAVAVLFWGQEKGIDRLAYCEVLGDGIACGGICKTGLSSAMYEIAPYFLGILPASKLRRLILAVGLLVISGCAGEVCIHPNTYWPSVISTGTVNSSIQQNKLLLDINSVATIELFECGHAYRDANLSAIALCIQLRIEDSHSFQFLSSSVKIVSESGKVYDYALEKISYRVFVSYEKDGSEQPDSSLKPPTLAPVDIKTGDKHGNGRTDDFSFPSDAHFYGASSTYAPPMQRALFSVARRRMYSTSVEFHTGLGRRFTIEMPRIKVDGKEYVLPTVAWAHSSKELCIIVPP